MELLVVRHAKAEMLEHDYQRSLTDDGRIHMRDVSKFLKERLRSIDVLASSPLVRTLQTAAIIGEAFGIKVIEQTDYFEPGAPTIEILNWVKKAAKRPNVKTICIVGHEPDLGIFCSFMLSGEARSFIDFEKSGALLLEFPDGFVIEGSALLRWYHTPY